MELAQREKARLKEKYGPWALVTGASSGIGRELALRLAEAGLNVVLTARRVPVLDELAGQIRAEFGVQTRVQGADLARQEGTGLVLEAVKDLDVGLFVAAAGFGTSGLFAESDRQQELEMLRVNCESLFVLSHHFSRVFSKAQRGGMILLSSIVGFQGVPYAAHYAATKAYVQSLAEGLAVELKPLGVDVLAAAPAPVDSGFAERAKMQMGMSMKPADVGVPILKALGRKSSVWPGWLSKFLIGSLSTAPRWGKVRIMKAVMGGMTKHRRAS